MDEIEETNEFDLEETPEEVMDFVYSKDYENKINTLVEKFRLSPNQKTSLEYCVLGLVTNNLSTTESSSILSKIITNQADLKSIEDFIENNFVVPAFNMVSESLKKIDDDDSLDKDIELFLNSDDTVEESVAPSPSEMIARLNDKLTKPAFTVPTKNDYSSEKTITKVETPTIRNIDPYREQPNAVENE